jgi:hypothetical protein
MENPWWQIFLRDLRLYTPFLPYAAIYAGTIIVTWITTRVVTRWKWQQNIKADLDGWAQHEIGERDKTIEAHVQQIEELVSEVKQHRRNIRVVQMQLHKTGEILQDGMGEKARPYRMPIREKKAI